MNDCPIITSPDDDALDELCRLLADRADELDAADVWPAEQLELCGKYGVFQWFLPVQHGGQGWSDADVVRGYLKLSAACLTTTFIITQRTGACRRISICDNQQLKTTLLPDLLSGKTFATVGISHLTTSRRHLARPVLRAEESGDGWLLDGYSPWVTGAAYAEVVVIGATLENGRQLLAALPTDLAGVSIGPPAKLVGVSAGKTGPLNCDRVKLDRRWLLAGPSEGVMKSGIGAKSGGLQTSTLAVGLSTAAIDYLEAEGRQRAELLEPAAGLRHELESVRAELFDHAENQPTCTIQQLRIRANSLVLRSTQAALAAAKGTGYVVGHPAGRWCREALFFLVWSCPQPVMAANLCELAGIRSC